EVEVVGVLRDVRGRERLVADEVDVAARRRVRGERRGGAADGCPGDGVEGRVGLGACDGCAQDQERQHAADTADSHREAHGGLCPPPELFFKPNRHPAMLPTCRAPAPWPTGATMQVNRTELSPLLLLERAE